ncbi:trichohyalin [Thalictrum thalictroides]|uniref:Trichohyalin n=1 Tax=Thalictrum thalictroides TaxID=46969 RepID=A0A7J6UYB0_THATH|nr:trichohyalin [Thalictrum thalictroides]
MATKLLFSEEEMMVDECVGYPKAYAKLCRDHHINPYAHRPPFTFMPFALPPQEVSRTRDLDKLFPIIDLEAKPSTKPQIYVNILWKQLSHLGNAGFDPAKFRVDPYGNVLYYHADSASPLAWEIDHWFPYSRGGKTVPCNLRLLQRQVYKKKHNKLEFLVPWWDLQLGVSVNQFLSIFASSNSDFRCRAFSLLFSEGENKELNDSQTVDSYIFPQHFVGLKEKVGLAPAAIVLSRRESSDSSSVLRSVDVNRKSRAHCSATDARKFLVDENEPLCKSIQMFRPSVSKENDDPNDDINPYLTIALARDSLRQREEMQAEIRKLDMDLDDLNKKNEVERVTLQDLESVLIKRRRRAEKSRRLAEAQSSYKALLEKMIRDAMHQSVIYKEQLRLNQAATSALMARLEAQKAICDSSERDLHRKFKQRDEIEKQIRPQWEHGRKRSRMDEILPDEEKDCKALLYLPEIKPRKTPQKELRKFLEEEQKASEAGLSLTKELVQEQRKSSYAHILKEKPWEHKFSDSIKDETPIEDMFQKIDFGEVKKRMKNIADSVPQSPEKEDEECRKQRGKGNVEKWLQLLLDDSKDNSPLTSPCRITFEEEKSKTDDIIEKLNLKNPQKEIRFLKVPVSEEKAGFNQNCDEIKTKEVQEKDGGKRTENALKVNGNNMYDRSNVNEVSNNTGKGIGSSMSFGAKERRERSGKEKELTRSESARAFRPIPYSPSVILVGMKKGVDCLGKKPITICSDEDNDEDQSLTSNFFKSSVKNIKKAVKI